MKTYEGVYFDLSSEEYHGHKESFSRSALMDFDRSPYTYWAKHKNPKRPERLGTPQMELGSAFHTLMLEPEKFEQEYCVLPEKVLLKNVGREVYEAYKEAVENAETGHRKVLSLEVKTTLDDMRDKFEQNPQAIQLLRDARIENSFFWTDPGSGLLLKSRPDILHHNMIVDLKTCSDASPRAFQREMVQYGYHVQGAMVRDAVETCEGRRINHVINVCIETKYPYNMAIYIIDEFAIDEGEYKYKQLCMDLKNAIEYNEFADYGIQTIGLPKWAS